MVKAGSHIPKIRFQGFSDVWNSVIIDELVNKKIIDKPMDGNHGEIHPTSDDYVDDGISFVMANDIFNGQLHLGKSKKISYELSKTLRKGFAQEGDILLTHKATIGETAIVPKLNNPYIVLTPQVTYYRILQQNKLHRYFLKSNFQSPSFVKCLQQAVTGATRLYIGITEQRSLKLNLTTIQEQTQIGNFFQKIDQVIELQQKALDTARDYKKSMLQKMFPQKGEKVPQIRFDGFNGDWEKYSLGQCFSERNERSALGDLLSVTINNGIVLASDLNRRDSSSEDKSNYKKICINDIAYNSMRMWQGASGVSKYNGIASPAYTVLTPKKNMDSLYFSFYFKNALVINEFRKNSQGLVSDTWNLKFPILQNIKVLVPDYIEQKKIGEFFQKLDQQIEQHEKKLANYQNLKKAMLQRMFV